MRSIHRLNLFRHWDFRRRPPIFETLDPTLGLPIFGDFGDMVIPVAFVLLSERTCRVVTAQPIGVARGRDLRVAVPGDRRSLLPVGQPLSRGAW